MGSFVRLLGFTTLGCGCIIGRYRELATNRDVNYVEEKGDALQDARSPAKSHDRRPHGGHAAADGGEDAPKLALRLLRRHRLQRVLAPVDHLQLFPSASFFFSRISI